MISLVLVTVVESTQTKIIQYMKTTTVFRLININEEMNKKF
jgi:hypothetical protein